MSHHNLTADNYGYVTKALEPYCSVSRETYDRLSMYVSLLLEWNEKFNLIGPGTVDHVWNRHVLDCAQLMPVIGNKDASIVDIGTGAGLPGMVLALLGCSKIDMVEANGKKVSFLREVLEKTGINASIHHSRAEELPVFKTDIVTARAVAPLSKLIGYAIPFAAPHTRFIFLKGKTAAEEVEAARAGWQFDIETIPSHDFVGDGGAGSILVLNNVSALKTKKRA